MLFIDDLFVYDLYLLSYLLFVGFIVICHRFLSFFQALKFISDEKTTIIARSRAYRKLNKLRKAMQDADLALKLEPMYHEVGMEVM